MSKRSLRSVRGRRGQQRVLCDRGLGCLRARGATRAVVQQQNVSPAPAGFYIIYRGYSGGATELMIDDNLIGVRSIANRLLAFKSNILHRSTPFTNYPRWTIALKYNKFITPEDVRARTI